MGLKEFLFGIMDERLDEYESSEGRNRGFSSRKEERIFEPKETKPTGNYQAAQNRGVSPDRRGDRRQDALDLKMPLIMKEKDVVIIVIENTINTRGSKSDILQLANKIFDSNKDCFFLLMRMGGNKKIYNILNYDSLNREEILNNWFDEGISDTCDYVEILRAIDEFYKSTIGSFEFEGDAEEKVKKYSIQNINIVFVGSGNIPENEEVKRECINLLRILKEKIRIKSIKYFCMLDKQTQNVAKLGFPVIGHIETDFYK